MSQSSRPYKMILVETDGDIVTVTINRPEKRNAMNHALIEELDHFFSKPPKKAGL